MKRENDKKELFFGLRLAIPLIFYILATVSPMLVRLFIPVTKAGYISTSIKLIILCFTMFYLVPFKIGIPSSQKGSKNLRDIGVLPTQNIWKSVLTGLLFGLTSLFFMLIGSLLSGEFIFQLSSINPQHVYFSLVPGVFEEVIFRGFLMIVLIKHFKNIKKAIALQVFLFTLSHVKDISLLGFVDIMTVAVIALAFTYVVLKTGNLYAAIVFHFIHDAFLFVVQLPESSAQSIFQQLLFYASVWIGMLVIIMMSKLLTGEKHKKDQQNIYLKALNSSYKPDIKRS